MLEIMMGSIQWACKKHSKAPLRASALSDRTAPAPTKPEKAAKKQQRAAKIPAPLQFFQALLCHSNSFPWRALHSA
jgi:hypothetical protein